MKCQTAQKIYLLYIDNELSKYKTNQVQDHLSSCAACSLKMNALKEIYQSKSRVNKIEASPFMWQKLYLKISEQEKKSDKFLFPEKLMHFLINVGMAAIFVLSVLLGIYLGSSPNITNVERVAEAHDVIVNDEFENDSYINTLDDLPRESIANVYLTMEME